MNKQVLWAILDTGADISVMSRQCYDSLPKKYKRKLGPKRLANLSSVMGHTLMSLGSAQVQFEISDTKLSAPFKIIEGITRQILLGSDFLAANQATLDYQNRIIRIGNRITLLKQKSDIEKSCYLVQLADKIRIPLESEVFVSFKISRTRELL